MSKQDEAFEKWMTRRDKSVTSTWGLLQACHNDGFAAGREAERERVLGIIAELKTSHEQTLEPQRPMFNMPINVYINACDEITRRIKESDEQTG